MIRDGTGFLRPRPPLFCGVQTDADETPPPPPRSHGLRGVGICLNPCAFSVSDNPQTTIRMERNSLCPSLISPGWVFLLVEKTKQLYLIILSCPPFSRLPGKKNDLCAVFIPSVLLTLCISAWTTPLLLFLLDPCSLLPLLKPLRFLVPCFSTEALYSTILRWVKVGWWFDEKNKPYICFGHIY